MHKLNPVLICKCSVTNTNLVQFYKLPHRGKFTMAEKDFPFTFDSPCQDFRKSKLKVFEEGSIELNVTKVMPGRVFLPKAYEEDAKKIYNMEVRPDDIWIVTYPKCGTTWTQESVWQIVNFDLETMIPFEARSPFLELGHLIKSGSPPPNKDQATPEPLPEFILDPVSFVEKIASPRVIKSHLPMELLPHNLVEKCKVVYVCRNPKDTCVSYYHHSASANDFYKLYGNFEDYNKLFLDGRLLYGDYWHHLKGGWAHRNHKNFKFIWYEDMKKDHKAGLKNLSQFLGYQRTEEELEALVNHLTLENMRNKFAARAMDEENQEWWTKFFRKGQVGDWNNYFEGETLQKWDEWIKRNLEGTDIEMKFK